MRLIMIDNHSGFIFGDTSEISDFTLSDKRPVDACQLMDEQEIGEFGRAYTEVSELAANETGYLIYQSDDDAGLSDCIGHIFDGRDAEMIEAVESKCKLVAKVRCERPEA